MEILCIGHATYDITIVVDEYPKENDKYRIKDRTECGGGPASNAAYLLSKWGVTTYFAGLVGNDAYGRRIKEEFDEIGVNTKYMEISDKASTTSSFILANKENGSRTVFAYKKENEKMDIIDFKINPSLILIDGQEPRLSNAALNKFPNAISVIDAGRDTKEVRELCKKVDYVACSKNFAESVTGVEINYTYTNSIIEAFKVLKDMFKTNIIITLESHGCVYEKDGAIRIMPSIKVKPKDSTAAGDIFHGALAYGIAHNFPYETTLKYANIAGALSTEKVGGRFSIPTKKEVESRYVRVK